MNEFLLISSLTSYQPLLSLARPPLTLSRLSLLTEIIHLLPLFVQYGPKHFTNVSVLSSKLFNDTTYIQTTNFDVEI